MAELGDTERAWLERQLAELRAREGGYRERLATQQASVARLRAHSEALQQLFRRHPPSKADLSRTLSDAAQLSGHALGISRASVWLFDETREHLNCVIQLVDGVEGDTSGVVIASSDCPRYVHALTTESAIAVFDASDDLRTSELRDYLRERDIHALLDIPIVIPGDLLGVVCHEHVGAARAWQPEEIEFASHVGYLVAVALETERRISAEYAARGVEAKYRHLVESLPVTVYSFDMHSGKLDYVSPQIAELGGWSADELLSRGTDEWISRIFPEDRAPILERLEGGATGFPEEATYRIRTKDESVRWIRDTCRVVRDPMGLPIAIQGILADVTEKTEAELSRIEFERRYRALLENVDLVAVSLDARARITFVNEAFVRLSGYARQSLVGRDWFEVMLPEGARGPVRSRFLDDLQRQTVIPRFEVGVVTRTGELRRLLCASTILRSPDGSVEGTSSLALDVTDRRRLEAELMQQTKLESLGRLAASIAHDFNNLLTVLVGEFGFLKRAPASVPRVRMEAIDQALAQATDLTNSLLAYGRQQPFQRELLLADDVVMEAMSLVRALAGGALSVSTSLHAEGHRVKMDRASLRQVLLNLVGNAVDATRDHGKSIHIETHVELVDEHSGRPIPPTGAGEFLVLSVVDDGRGMDAQTAARIFEPFFTTKSEGHGTGLGLGISQMVVNEAGGFITVESKVAEGTAFKVYLPSRGSVSRASAPQRSAGAGVAARRVLVVEDVTAVADLVVASLRVAGYEPVAVTSTRAAMQVIASEPVDLLLTDVNLPDGSGTVLARTARAIRPGLRVVLMSGTDDLSQEFDATLKKPFDEATLLAAVGDALGRPKQS